MEDKEIVFHRDDLLYKEIFDIREKIRGASETYDVYQYFTQLKELNIIVSPYIKSKFVDDIDNIRKEIFDKKVKEKDTPYSRRILDIAYTNLEKIRYRMNEELKPVLLRLRPKSKPEEAMSEMGDSDTSYR